MPRTISWAAAEAGVHVETIRYYERRGLVERPQRSVNGGYRTYSEEAIARVRFIRTAQSLGFSLSEVEALLTLKGDPDADCSDIRARAAERLDKIDEHIADLVRKRAALAEIIKECPGQGGVRRCAILDALDA